MEVTHEQLKVSFKTLEPSESDCIHDVLCLMNNCVKQWSLWIEYGKFTMLYIPETLWIVQLKKAISLGIGSDILEYKRILNIEELKTVYKQKNRILVVRIDDSFYLMKDKNNYKLVTSLLTKELKPIERTIDLTSKADYRLLANSTNSSKSTNCDTITASHERTKIPSETDNHRQKSKIVLPRGRTVVVLDRAYDEENNSVVNPFNGISYDKELYSQTVQDSRPSIQVTDGACSLPRSSIATNYSKYSPTSSDSSTQNTIPENTALSKTTPPRYPNMKEIDARRRTFSKSGWETHPYRPSVDESIEWGFFYTGRHDLLRCFQCGIGLKDWSIEDVVRNEHIRHSSDCTFLKVKIGQENLNVLKLQLLYETDSNPCLSSPTWPRNQAAAASTVYTMTDYTASHLTNLTNTTNKSADKRNVNKNDEPKLAYPIRHPHHQTIKSRLDTFSTFPRTVQQDPRKLVAAGFFYTGNEDTCRCFCCDGGMRNWEPKDDPIIEHAKHFPTCNYIRQIKGDAYIRRVRIEAGMETEEKSSSQQNGYGVHSPVEASQVYESSQGMYPEFAASNKKERPNRSTIVKNVIQSGFEKEKVEKAVDILLKRGIIDFIEDDIVNVILDLPEANEQPETNTVLNDVSPDVMLLENERLKSVLHCIKCIKEEANILFLPCAHHKMCQKCSEQINTCPVCSREIKQKVKTYMS